MRRTKSWLRGMVVTLSLCGAMVATATAVHAQVSDSLDWLSPETLRDFNLYLPSYFSSVQAQMSYQAKVPLHQEITVAWSANASGQPAGGAGFVLVKRWQHMPKSASLSPLKPHNQPILVIAATPAGEVRALALYPDTRSTTGQFDLQLPQDGQISRLIFLTAAAGSPPERIAELDLGPPEGTPQRVSQTNTRGQARSQK
jgi:hypothetical protein